MTFLAALILSCVAVALVVWAAVQIAHHDRAGVGSDHSAEGTGQVESELLRRPLRSRYSA